MITRINIYVALGLGFAFGFSVQQVFHYINPRTLLEPEV
jgi:hypothetical protein